MLKYKNERYAGSVVRILIQNMSVCKNQDWSFTNEKFYFNFILSFLCTREQNGRLDTEINAAREKQNLLFLLYTIPSNMTFWPEKKGN